MEIIYKAFDGEVFTEKEKCQEYENDIKLYDIFWIDSMNFFVKKCTAYPCDTGYSDFLILKNSKKQGNIATEHINNFLKSKGKEIYLSAPVKDFIDVIISYKSKDNLELIFLILEQKKDVDNNILAKDFFKKHFHKIIEKINNQRLE